MRGGGGRSPAPAPPTTGSTPVPPRVGAPRARAGTAALVVTTAVLTGCSLLRGGARPEGDPPGRGPGTAGDTTAAPAGGPKDPASDSARSLRDSLRAAMGDSAAAAATRDSMEAAATPPSGPVYVTDVEKLARMGPAYTPYDIGPALERGQRLEGLLRATILPVVRKHDLEPDEWARFWVLVDREGRVVATRLHLTSSHAVFDSAARAAAERFRYRPAKRDGETVPVWVLVRVSLLMG